MRIGFIVLLLLNLGYSVTGNAQAKTTIQSGTFELKSPDAKDFEIKPLKPPSPWEAPTPQTSKQKIQITPLTETEPTTIPYQPQVVSTTRLLVELILDASGSMNGFLGTDSKIEMVKALIADLSRQWASSNNPPVELGIRVFGAKEPITQGKCDDTELLYPIGSIDLGAIKKSLTLLRAQGTNPIALAIEKGAEDLSAQVNGDRIIILLTDGKESCGQDPCAAAKLVYDRSSIIVHVVAFDVAAADEASIKCIADSSRGRFLLARSKEELASALDEALRSTIPYNLRLKVLVGGTPLPSMITVYKAGTQNILQREESFGIELLRLPPGAYDILVEYHQSISEKKPSKVLKGVELTQTGKVEQEIRFDLAAMTLAAFDKEGKPAKTEYILFKAGEKQKIASAISEGVETTFFIEPGMYDLVANRIAPEGQAMTLAEKNITTSLEQGFSKIFSFQTGTLVLKGMTSAKQPVALAYKVKKPGDEATIILEGEVEKTGGKIELPPDVYDIVVEGFDPSLASRPKGKLENITVEGGSLQEQTITLTVGTLKLKAVKAGEEAANAEFIILDPETEEVVAKAKGEKGEANITLSPGKYQAQAQLISDVYQEGPKTEKTEVVIVENKETEATLRFELGTLKILGRNAKEQKLETTFTIYEGATENVVATAGPVKNWITFDLSPGNYDIKAVQSETKAEGQPTVWQRNIDITIDSLYVREMVFTNAKLRLIGRGTNNEVIPVQFKVYKYGHDRPLFDGITGQDWQSFDINPDQYYIEASYHDPDSSQILKKWVSLKVNENEFVEKELRF